MRTRSLLPVALGALGAILGWLAASGPSAEAFARAKNTTDPSAQADGAQLPKPDPEFKGKIGETFKRRVFRNL